MTASVIESVADWMGEARSFVTVSFKRDLPAHLAHGHTATFLHDLARASSRHLTGAVYGPSGDVVSHVHLALNFEVTRDLAEASWRYSERGGRQRSMRPTANVHAVPISPFTEMNVHRYGALHGDVDLRHACPRGAACRRGRGCVRARAR